MTKEAERLAARWETKRRLAEERRYRAQDFARELARTLGRSDPTVKAIIGFGSTFETWRQYRQDSDIDLALIGGDWNRLWSMIPRSDALRQLVAELEQDYDFILRNGEKNAAMTARIALGNKTDEYDYAALGYTLHNLYNAFEGYFLRVAKFLENNLDELTWHKALLERMPLHMDGIRPALIDLPISLRIEELLKFRYVFRNLYKSPLIPAKVDFANQVALHLSEDFKPYHEGFLQFLRNLIQELDADAGGPQRSY